MFIIAGFTVAATACDGEAPQAHEKVVQHINNHIDYVEFAAEDPNVIKAFYKEAFGREFQDWGPDYVSFSGAGLEGGVLVILYADDLDATEKRVVSSGGEIVERHEFPGGKRFHFRDLAGNVLGVWTVAQAKTE